MLKRAKSLLLAIAVCAVGMIVPLSGSNTAKAASTTDTQAGSTASWMRGSNLTCGTDNAFYSLAVMKKNGFTAVNLNWSTGLSAEKLDAYLTECEKLGLQAVVSLWDAYGKSDFESLSKCVDYWIQGDVAKVMRNHKSATIEVAAGWDPGDTATWQAAYEKYLPLIDDAFQYDCNVCLSTPSCMDCSSAEDAAQKIVAASDIIAKRLHWIHISIDVYIITFDKWGTKIISIVYKHYDVWILSDYDETIIETIIIICRGNLWGCFPIKWYDPAITYSMTSDWVNYTPIGKNVSNLMLS